MKGSKIFTLQFNDLVKGTIMAILGAIAGLIITIINSNSFTFDWPAIGKAALIAGITYLTKNFFTNSNNHFLTKEQK